jgi:hypothetical protein
MFNFDKPMSFGKRLSLYWSCLWRQLLAGCAVWLAGMVTGIVWTLSRFHHSHSLTAAKALPLLVEAVVVVAAMLPISGYMVRPAYAKHGFRTPARLRFLEATTFGLEAMTWGLVGELAAIIPTYMLRTSGHSTLAMALHIVVGTFVCLYVVLPRQALRLRRLSSANLESATDSPLA